MVKKAFLEEFHSDDSLRGVINRIEIGLPFKTPHQPTQWSEVKKVKGKPGTVVTGIIDDGLAFAHELFRHKPKKTRIEYLWNQDGLPPNPPAGFFDGWELRKHTVGAVQGIDDYLKNSFYGGLADEDQIYAWTNHVDFKRSIHKPAAQRAAHGTHVMHLASGYPLTSAPDDRPIIGVQLPVATTADTSGATFSKYVLEGLHYILARADTLTANPPPVVVNLSYGLIAGPHNGSSILEAAIDELIDKRQTDLNVPLRVVLPAGNSRLARCHAQFALDANKKHETLRWRILPDDRTPSFMEVWLPDPGGNPPVVEVTVTTPTGDASPPIQQGEEYAWQDGGEVLCKVLYLTTAAPGRTRDMIFIAVAPTATLDSTRKLAPFGTWQVKVETKGAGQHTIDAWIQRDDTPFGYPVRGRQSRFDDLNYVYRDDAGREVEADVAASYVKRDGTINAMSTGSKSIIIGGMKRRHWRPAKYSAGGPVIAPPGRGAPISNGPDAMTVSDDSPAYSGVLAAGTRSRSTVAMDGTSVAAPQITRWIAGEIGAGRPSDRNAVATLVIGPPPPEADPAPPPERGGAGRVEFAPVVSLDRFDK
jgi:hypothetical protein